MQRENPAGPVFGIHPAGPLSRKAVRPAERPARHGIFVSGVLPAGSGLFHLELCDLILYLHPRAQFPRDFRMIHNSLLSLAATSRPAVA